MVERTENSRDLLGSRFVRIEGLEKPIFELETPLARFILKAVGEGAHLTKPKIRQLTPEGWERMVNIVVLTAFGKEEGGEILGKPLSYEDIGREYSLNSRQHVERIVKGGIRAHFKTS